MCCRLHSSEHKSEQAAGKLYSKMTLGITKTWLVLFIQVRPDFFFRITILTNYADQYIAWYGISRMPVVAT